MSLKIFVGIFWSKYYDSIYTCPIKNFSDCIKSRDGDKLRKNGFINIRKAKKAYERLMNEYINVYGLPENYKDYIEKMKEASEYYDQVYNENMRWQLVRARIAEAEAKKIISMGESEAIELTTAKLSKYLGFRLNLQEMTVSEFYSYIEMTKDGR